MLKSKGSKKEIDVCLILEGTYPYVRGGVSSWVHELICYHKELNFQILSILPPDNKKKLEILYDVPKNVTEITNIYLQDLPFGSKKIKSSQKEELLKKLEVPILNMQSRPTLRGLGSIIRNIEAAERDLGVTIGRGTLMDSKEAWVMLLRMYNMTMGNSCFLDYFWSWRALLGSFYSILLAPLPEAKVYHALCTGYAGLYLARAKYHEKKPCIITEHGIYTNERRIEIYSAEWLEDEKSLDFNVDKKVADRDLRDFWIDSFTGYSKLCYDSCDKIITLYEGNTIVQLQDGAPQEKLSVIPNGIDYEKFSGIKRKSYFEDKSRPPSIALIGRVVPIKDIKTYIRACDAIRKEIPDIQAYIMGPCEEDEEYYEECVDLVNSMNLQKTVIFTGMVNLVEYLQKIDVQVLTSISEAQPLVILEAGAAGIPSVATNVGACMEMIFGGSYEDPPLGAGGDISALSNPMSVAESVINLLENKEYYDSCGAALKERVRKYYNKTDLHLAYAEIYKNLMAEAMKIEHSKQEVV